MKDRIILHLCAKEGSDSLPYRKAGYDVRIIGEDIGVENYTPPPNVYGIIANPPCTHFSIARSNAKTPRDLQEGMRLVKECLRIIWQCQYKTEWVGDWSSPLKFWVMENPARGFLRWFMGNPVFTYNHYEYGEAHSKTTALWGYFNEPKRPLLFNPIPTGREITKAISPAKGNCKNTEERTIARSRCPIGFAEAFYEANP